ncbi:hypothetical protein OG203_44270 [Nocardia sp. NBC_01499]|uniref:hypothetical protein n=1 Tax=Nocardia sp. NBC_01499 TaxID=2903597 RepID=UPI003862D6C9
MDALRLGSRVKARRLELRLARTDLKALGGPSGDTVRRIEEAVVAPASIRRATLEGLDIALGWRQGSCQEILAGQQPVTTNDYTTTTIAQQALSGIDKELRVVPGWMVTNLAALVSELMILTRVDQVNIRQITETVSRTHTLATDMLALAAAAERNPAELAQLIGVVESARNTRTDHTDTVNYGSRNDAAQSSGDVARLSRSTSVPQC